MHLLTVINDILDLSKIEANKMTVEQTKTPIVQIIHEVTSLMRPSLPWQRRCVRDGDHLAPS